MQGLEIHFYLWAFEWDMLIKLDRFDSTCKFKHWNFLLSILCFITSSHYVMQLHLLIFSFLSSVDSCLTSCILSLIKFVMNNKKPITSFNPNTKYLALSSTKMVCDFIMCTMPIFNHLKKGNIKHVHLGKLVIRFLCKQYHVFGCSLVMLNFLLWIFINIFPKFMMQI
jgi:hypothetical protein